MFVEGGEGRGILNTLDMYLFLALHSCKKGSLLACETISGPPITGSIVLKIGPEEPPYAKKTWKVGVVELGLVDPVNSA